ncbi:MAG TPA: putative 4-mercaptohistidine N1-methyltransferase [Chthoniobacteraceae bacterium]|nr:putative 4-mercaptohistidine N1-methyltransferase [Chthoniobacteraceae bacterium]
MPNIYETERLLAEYLLFHYGGVGDVFTGPWEPPQGMREALHFPERTVNACFDFEALPPGAHALDVGCAVGRAAFELARHCGSVTAIDFSRRFIEAANILKRDGALPFARIDEGARTIPCTACVPRDIPRDRVSFETGDAMDLRAGIGPFDAVLAANLLCRLPDPAKFLARLPALVKPGGQLVITTPCTWLEEFTPRANWLCGESSSTLDGLHRHLDPYFNIVKQTGLPFVIREHARKFQWTMAQATLWRRRHD